MISLVLAVILDRNSSMSNRSQVPLSVYGPRLPREPTADGILGKRGAGRWPRPIIEQCQNGEEDERFGAGTYDDALNRNPQTTGAVYLSCNLFPEGHHSLRIAVPGETLMYRLTSSGTDVGRSVEAWLPDLEVYHIESARLQSLCARQHDKRRIRGEAVYLAGYPH